MGLEVPDWTHSVYPEPANSIAARGYSYYNYNPRVKQINSGYMLQKILRDFKDKIDNNLRPKHRKIFLYSGHESTIGFMLDALRVNLEYHIPPYGSALSFELHKGETEYYVKVITSGIC